MEGITLKSKPFSDNRYPLSVFGGRGYNLDTKVCLFVPLFLSFRQDGNIKKVLQYVDIVGLVSLSPFGFVPM